MRKPAFCILCKNKVADQLHGNRAADQRFCVRYTGSTIPLLPFPKFQASNHLLWLCRTWSETPTPKTDFLMTWLIYEFQPITRNVEYHMTYHMIYHITAQACELSPCNCPAALAKHIACIQSFCADSFSACK